MFDDLRSKITTEEFDYQALMDGLREYDRPRDKITDLLRRYYTYKEGYICFWRKMQTVTIFQRGIDLTDIIKENPAMIIGSTS